MKKIVLLGSTGSVGKNVLDVVKQFPDNFCIEALSAGNNIKDLTAQIQEFSPKFAAISNEKFYSEIKKYASDKTKVLAGSKSIEELAALDSADIVFISISGTAALRPLIAALRAGKTVALASKEPIVSAGSFIRKIKEENSACIIPVDSEHSAIMQCINGMSKKSVRKLYITGSGGSLKDTEKDRFDSLTVNEVLNHPKWNMGRKITVDSATLMNKGLEAIEARWLFDIEPEKIDIVIHPEAIIHSMVEFIDGTVNATLFSPDMRFPIVKALSYPDIFENNLPRVDFLKIKNFSFLEPDRRKFPAIDIVFESLREGGTMPAVLNGSNEAAVNLFLDGKIKFTDIMEKVEFVLKKHKKINNPDLEDIISSEAWAIREVLESC